MNTAYLNCIATAVPPYEVHQAFIDFAKTMLMPAGRRLFQRMSEKAAIEHRYSFIKSWDDPESLKQDGHFYQRGCFPETSVRMQAYEQYAPLLASVAVDKLVLGDKAQKITHLIITSCTGMYAPGLDLDLINHLGLNPTVERTMIGFMGCYAAINALKLSRHIVRSEKEAYVLILNLELCTLHMQETKDIEQVLSFLVFGDGCAASIVSAEPIGFALGSFHAMLIPRTEDLITWRVGALGFDMNLSGQVPHAINESLKEKGDVILAPYYRKDIKLWAIHPGGRSVLDAVQQGLALEENDLQTSRAILARYGNMSSATIMFVLQALMADAVSGQKGCGMSFGPGLTAETFLFHAA